MKNIDKILVPVDFSNISESALLTAQSLAEQWNAELHLIHVIGFNADSFSVLPETQIELPAMKNVEEAVAKKMSELVDFIEKDSGLVCQTYQVVGDIHHEIVRYAEAYNIDLIVMGTHGASGYKELFIGSNSHRVVTLSKIPVLTLQEDKDDIGYKDILLPIGDSLLSREKVKIAALMAKTFDATIHILGLSESDSKQEIYKVDIKSKSLEKYMQDEGIKFTREVKSAKNIAQGALDYAKDRNCDLIILNSGHESEITGAYLGVFAQQIVNHSKIPVITYKSSHGEYLIETPGYGIG